MSPIGRIFSVLNLVLAALFLGWASNNLASHQSWQDKHKALEEASSAEIDDITGQLSTLRAEHNTLQDTNGNLRNEKQTSEDDNSRLASELKSETDKNTELRGSVDNIENSLQSYAENSAKVTQDLSDKNDELAGAVASSRDAAAAAQAAQDAQRSAEEALASANKRIGDLETERTANLNQIEDLDAEVETLVAMTGTPRGEISAMKDIDGAVLEVVRNVAPGLIAINKGTVDGVERGYTFEIWNMTTNTYKGQVRVENVRDGMCTCIIVREVDGQAIVSGDSASTRI